MGRQFFISVTSPFFGISFIAAVRKLGVNVPLCEQKLTYLVNGSLKNFQNFFIKLVLMPSGPAAVLDLDSANAVSSSSIEISCSRMLRVAALIFIPLTISEFNKSTPRNSSMQPEISFFCSSGSLYRFS